MKARATLLAIPLIVGVAVAQSTSASSGQAQGSSGQSQSSSQSGSQAGSTAGSQAGSTAGSQNAPAEMKTVTYKGVLVDLACGSATASGAAHPEAHPSATAQSGSAGATAGGSTAAGSTAGAKSGSAGMADRSASDSNCPVTASSTQFGMKLDSGQVVRFDLVGNQRAQDALKSNKGWNKNLTANKPLKVKVSGVLQGDKLIVSSIN